MGRGVQIADLRADLAVQLIALRKYLKMGIFQLGMLLNSCKLDHVACHVRGDTPFFSIRSRPCSWYLRNTDGARGEGHTSEGQSIF